MVMFIASVSMTLTDIDFFPPVFLMYVKPFSLFNSISNRYKPLFRPPIDASGFVVVVVFLFSRFYLAVHAIFSKASAGAMPFECLASHRVKAQTEPY